jgi:hypothetical protein
MMILLCILYVMLCVSHEYVELTTAVSFPSLPIHCCVIMLPLDNAESELLTTKISKP